MQNIDINNWKVSHLTSKYLADEIIRVEGNGACTGDFDDIKYSVEAAVRLGLVSVNENYEDYIPKKELDREGWAKLIYGVRFPISSYDNSIPFETDYEIADAILTQLNSKK